MSTEVALLVTLFGFYSLTASRERPWVDARIMYEVAEQIVASHRVDVRTEWPPMSHKGPNGRLYSIYGLFPSLVSVPGVKLRDLATKIQPAAAPMFLVVTCHLANSLIAALTCLLFFRLARRLGVGRRAAILTTLILGGGTIIFVYARIPMSEALQALCFTGFAGELACLRADPSPRRALALGAWAGALVNTKLIFSLSLASGGIFVVVIFWRDWSSLRRVVGYCSLALMPLLALAAGYNYLRWGGPFLTGYEGVGSSATENPFFGICGLLFSTGKSVFIFSPPLVASVFLSRAFVRIHRRAAVAFAVASLPLVFAYARFTFWGGDWSWGPRYLNFLIPIALLPVAVALDRWLALPRKRAALGALATLAGAGLVVQILGGAFYWDHFIRVAASVKNQWLGTPNRALLKLGGPGICACCFEDMFAHDWLPPFSPIVGHAWLLRNLAAGNDWRQAEANAPWHRYTTLAMNLSDSYPRARIDWWGLLWLRDDPRVQPTGIALLIAFLGIFLGGAVMLVRGSRGPPVASEPRGEPAGSRRWRP